MSNTKLTPEIEAQIVKMIKDRVKDAKIISTLGISKRNFYNWKKSRPKLITAEKIRKNKEESIISNIFET